MPFGGRPGGAAQIRLLALVADAVDELLRLRMKVVPDTTNAKTDAADLFAR